MFRKSLTARLLVPTFTVVFLVVVLATVALAMLEAGRVTNDAALSIERQSRALQSLFSVTRAIMLDRVHGAMRLLRQQGEALGPASLGPNVSLPGREASDLLFGGRPQANAFQLVDSVTAILDGTATLFSRTGEDFVRISTNVKKDDGTRAIGTQLDPNGPVIAEIRKNLAYYGVVDILGNPYVTGYEPIFNADHDGVIGIWYVGYKTDLKTLDTVISESHVLQSGFVAVFDGKGKLRFRSHTLSDNSEAIPVELVERVAKDQPADWNVSRQEVPGWGFSLVSAYPRTDVSSVIQRQSLWIVGIGLLACLLLLGVQSALIWNRVLQPIQHLTAAADELSLGKWNHVIAEVRLEDEIGVLAKAIARMANSMRLAMDRLSRR